MSTVSQDFRVPGFLANGISCDIKENGKKDLSMIFSLVPAKTAAVFTTNSFKAAPVLLDMERIGRGEAQAIIANSGNANASTGDEGYRDARTMAKTAADALHIDEEHVLVASTGIIGERLPIAKIRSGMEQLVAGLNENGIPAAEEGIMTTDTFPKIEYRKFTAGKTDVTVCGIAKGAGMIEPHMATMLSFVMTDLKIDRETLNKVFRGAVQKSFNAITVDGCMSTNDTVIVLANGMANNRLVKGASRSLTRFRESLLSVMSGLAKAIVRDGEGATKVMAIVVENARTTHEARKIAYSIARSNLVKTAFFGRDPNWGRIIAAIGASGVSVPVDLVTVCLDEVPVFSGGTGVTGYEGALSDIMARGEITVRVTVGTGTQACTLYASDLSYEYVKINAHYHT